MEKGIGSKMTKLVSVVLMIFAGLLSWSVSHSVIFVIIHAIISPIYILYWLCTYGVGAVPQALGLG